MASTFRRHGMWARRMEGIQNGTRDDGLTIVNNAPYLHGGLAVQIDPPLPWVNVEPPSAVVPANSALDLDLAFDASGLAEGVHVGSLRIVSNDPGHALLYVPLAYHVAMPVAVGFALEPERIVLGAPNMEKYVSAYFEPPPPLAPSDLDVSTVRLNGLVAPDPTAPARAGDHDGDGVPDLEVRFARSDLALAVPGGDDIPIEASGMVGTNSFCELDSVRMESGRISSLGAQGVLAPGHLYTLAYDVSIHPVQWVALVFSPDRGSTWTMVTTHESSTGTLDWCAPNVLVDSALVALVEVEDGVLGNSDVSGVLAVSAPFSIQGMLGVGGGGHGVRLLPPSPNPSGGSVRLGFTVDERSTAEVAVFDLQGRRVATLARGFYGAGSHEVVWDGSWPSGSRAGAGLYFVRLRIGGREWKERLVRLE